MPSLFILKNTTLTTLTYGGRTLPAASGSPLVPGENQFDSYPAEVINTMMARGLKADIIAGDIIVNNGSVDLSAARGWRYLLDFPAKVYRHNGPQVQVFAAAYTSMLFDAAVDVADDIFTYHPISEGPTVGGSVDVLENGLYEVAYEVTITNETTSRSESQVRITVNGVEVPGSLASGYHRTSTVGAATVSAKVIVELSANDTIRIQARNNSGGNLATVANGCRLNIRKVSE